MSTRALYTFTDESGEFFNVYKHHDGYPSGAVQFIQAAIPFAWALPRFEADEFGAAFIAANKGGSGGVRLMPCGKPQEMIPANCADIEFRYEMTESGGKLRIKAYQVQAWTEYSESLFYDGDLIGLRQFDESSLYENA